MTVSLEELTDEQLLTRYLTARDQGAFAVIVRRYGPLVWGVCRRVLGNTHDAEDAFQASFVVLVNKAKSIRKMKSIAGWLHKVSHHVAVRARKRASERDRPTSLSELGKLMASAAPSSLPDEDMLQTLNEEIARLPDALRESVVLCYMQGLTNDQAAKQLGCPEGTVVSRLARARDRLQRRLRSRGLVLSGVMALAALLEGSATASPPPLLVQNVLLYARSASGVAVLAGSGVAADATFLAKQTLREMLKQQIVKWCAAALLGSVVTAGAWALWMIPRTAPNAARATVDQTALGLLDGTWQAENLEFAAGATPAERQEFIDRSRWVIDRGDVRLQWLWETRAVVRIAPLAGPPPQTAELTVIKGPASISGKTLRVVFEVQADHLSLRILSANDDATKAHGVGESAALDPVAAQVGLAGLSEFRRQTAVESATFDVRASAMHMLQGTWGLQSWSKGGKTYEVDAAENQYASIEIDRIEIHYEDNSASIAGKLVLDSSEPDRFLEIVSNDGQRTDRRKCLYEVNGETLRLCISVAGRDRPHDLTSRAGNNTTSFVFQHQGNSAAQGNLRRRDR